MAKSITEGTRTYCGIMLPHGRGWRWARSITAQANAKKHLLCKKCRRAMSHD
jgi:hypothetical protein